MENSDEWVNLSIVAISTFSDGIVISPDRIYNEDESVHESVVDMKTTRSQAVKIRDYLNGVLEEKE